MLYTVTLNPAVDRELAVPEIEFDSVLRASESRIDFGGKGFNVSRLLKSLGAGSVALGFAGGKSGELLRDGLESLGIDTDFTWIEGETRTNVSIVSTAQKRYVKANEPGPPVSAVEQQALLDKIRDLAREGDWWVVAGSLPPGVPEGIYAEIVNCVQASGGRAVLDSSGSALMQGCMACPYLVKPNAYEAARLTGLSVESLPQVALAAAAIRSIGPAAVVVSLGKDGALLFNEGHSWLARSPSIEERNPIGAGDSMVGGLVYGLQAGSGLVEALRWGVACGAATASLSGTAVGSRALVEELLDQVELKPLGRDGR
jgi:1-phosphofructokinase family hexose kinase